MYEPVSSVTALRFTPVAVCVAVTSTPGRTAPVWSFTVPLICAVACAHTIAVPKDRIMSTANRHRQTPIDFPIIDSLLAETTDLSNCLENLGRTITAEGCKGQLLRRIAGFSGGLECNRPPGRVQWDVVFVTWL